MCRNFFKFATVFTVLILPGLVPFPASAKPIWFHTRKDALAAARKVGKPILMDVNTTWCGPCQMMKRDVFEKPTFAKEASRWVLLNLDADAHAALAGFYKVEGFPTLIVMNAHGRVVSKQVGYGGPAATLKFLRSAYTKAKKP